MEKSLSDLLFEEKETLQRIDAVERSINTFEEEKERILESVHSIYVDQRHIDFCNRNIEGYKQDVKELNEKLLYIRRGMQEYLSYIMSL